MISWLNEPNNTYICVLNNYIKGKIKQEESIPEPVYYPADGIDYKTIKKRARSTTNRWIFPDKNLQKPIEMMRKKVLKDHNGKYRSNSR